MPIIDSQIEYSIGMLSYTSDAQWELLRDIRYITNNICYHIVGGTWDIADDCYPQGITDFEMATCKCRFDFDTTYEVQNLPVFTHNIQWQVEEQSIFYYSIDTGWDVLGTLFTPVEWKVINERIYNDLSWTLTSGFDSDCSWSNQQRLSHDTSWNTYDDIIDSVIDWTIQQRLEVDVDYKIWDDTIDVSTEWMSLLDIKNGTSWLIQQRLEVDTEFGIHSQPFFDSIEYKIFNSLLSDSEFRIQQRLEVDIESKIWATPLENDITYVIQDGNQSYVEWNIRSRISNDTEFGIFSQPYINSIDWSIQQRLEVDTESKIWATPISYSTQWNVGFQPVNSDLSWTIQQRLNIDTDYHIFDPLKNITIGHKIFNGVSANISYSIQNRLEVDTEWVDRYGEIYQDTESKIFNSVVTEASWKLFNTGFEFVTEYRIWDGILLDTDWNITGKLFNDIEWVNWNGFGSDLSNSIQQRMNSDTDWILRYGEVNQDISSIIQQRMNSDTSTKIFTDYKHFDLEWIVFDTGFSSEVEWKRATGFSQVIGWMNGRNVDNFDTTYSIQNTLESVIEFRIFDELLDLSSSWVLLTQMDNVFEWKVVNVDDYPTHWKVRYGEVNQDVSWIDWNGLESDTTTKIIHSFDNDIEWIDWNGFGSDETYKVQNRIEHEVESKIFHSLDSDVSYSVQQRLNDLTEWKLRYGEVNQDVTYGMLTGFDIDVEHLIIGGFDGVIDYRITSSILNTNIAWTINTSYLDVASSWAIYPENYIVDVAVSDFLGWRIASYNKSISEVIRDNKIEDVEYFNLAEILNKKL